MNGSPRGRLPRSCRVHSRSARAHLIELIEHSIINFNGDVRIERGMRIAARAARGAHASQDTQRSAREMYFNILLVRSGYAHM